MSATTPTRVIAILGAGGALGAAISSRLAGEPDTEVVLSDISDASLQATIANLERDGIDGDVETVLADVTDLAQVEAVVERTIERFGRLDVLISNAGVLAPNGRIHNLTDADWSRVVNINLMGAVHAVQAAVPVMRRQQAGSIILTASVAGHDRLVARRAVLRHQGRGHQPRQGGGRRIRPRQHPGQLCVPRARSCRRSTTASPRRRSTRWTPSTRSASGPHPTSSARTRTSRATPHAGRPARRSSSTAATPRRNQRGVSPRGDAARPGIDQQPSSRAMTTCWISLVPSPISSTFESQ